MHKTDLETGNKFVTPLPLHDPADPLWYGPAGDQSIHSASR